MEAEARRVEARLSELETRRAVDDVHRQNVEKRLSAIEDSLKWLVRLVVGVLLAAVLGAVAGGPLPLTL